MRAHGVHLISLTLCDRCTGPTSRTMGRICGGGGWEPHERAVLARRSPTQRLPQPSPHLSRPITFLNMVGSKRRYINADPCLEHACIFLSPTICVAESCLCAIELLARIFLPPYSLHRTSDNASSRRTSHHLLARYPQHCTSIAISCCQCRRRL